MSTIQRVIGQVSDYGESGDWTLLVLDNLVWPILIATFLMFAVLLPETFLTVGNMKFLLLSSAALGTLALAEALCLLSGHFDLSIGSIAGFSAIFTGLVMAKWFPGTPGIVGILLILLVGGTIGLLNGFSVAYLDVNPFLQTLSFLIIFRGATIAASTYPVTDLPESYLYVGGGSISIPGIFSVPVAIFILLGLFALAGVLLKYNPYGLAIYAIGGDKEASREAGLDTKKLVVGVYFVSGVLSGVGGLLFTGFLGAATPSLGEGALFPAFAAAVIGGISIFGGRGNILGALGGVLLLGTIQAGLVMMNIPPTIIRMANGIILLVAILLYTGVEKYREETLQV